MKKKIIAVVAAVFCVLFICGVSVSVKLAETKAVAAESKEVSPLEARFLNMLNHNFVYGEDFGSFDKIAEGSVLSMLSSREGDYVSETFVKGFVRDMYGLNIVSLGNEDDPHYKKGFVYINPMGFTEYSHSNITVNKNEDGTYTVLTDVTVNPHDSEPYKASAVSLFAPNNDSPFGYIIVYSNLSDGAVSY